METNEDKHKKRQGDNTNVKGLSYGELQRYIRNYAILGEVRCRGAKITFDIVENSKFFQIYQRSLE